MTAPCPFRDNAGGRGDDPCGVGVTDPGSATEGPSKDGTRRWEGHVRCPGLSSHTLLLKNTRALHGEMVDSRTRPEEEPRAACWASRWHELVGTGTQKSAQRESSASRRDN